ncbi:hypothetical protein ACS0TY_012279 [Phlomoides rotata]
MTGATTRFANDVFEQKRAMIWENRLIGTKSTQRKVCNMMHNGRWHERICKFHATQEKPLFGKNFRVRKDQPGKEFQRKKRTNTHLYNYEQGKDIQIVLYTNRASLKDKGRVENE